MTSITIITIVVVALLTAIIFGLAWLGYSSCLKAYKLEVDQGKHDESISKEYHSKKKHKSGLIGIIGSYLALASLVGLFAIGITYKANGENLTFNNQTALVIKTGSMSGYYDEHTAEELSEYPIYHFDVGDICLFEKVSEETELCKGEVYGYKHNNIIITHRLISFDLEKKTCRFKGDNNNGFDGIVPIENIVYHYTGNKVPGVGAFILYAQSYFGIWSILGIIGIAISSEVVYRKIEKINRARDKIIFVPEDKNKEPKVISEKKIRAQFYKRDGTLITIYKKVNKEPTAEAPSKTHEEKEGAEDEK